MGKSCLGQLALEGFGSYNYKDAECERKNSACGMLYSGSHATVKMI